MSFEIINRRKKELGIGNAELAAMSGVPKATIDKITSGATANPSLETMKSIAHALKRMVGHTKNMDTFGVYGHEVDGEAEKTAQIIDGVFNDLI